jgi:sulfur carrier protein
MQIQLNGQAQDVPDGITVSELLKIRSLDPKRVAVECNKQLVPRARHGEAVLKDGDAVEIVTLVGGG